MVNPIRCQKCGIVITAKANARKPKNCPPCRRAQQDIWKEQNSINVGPGGLGKNRSPRR